MSNQHIIGPGERPPDPNIRINDCLNYSGLATEQELQFLKLPSENQGILSKVGNFLAGIIGSPPTTNSGGTQTSTNNSLPGGGLPQISSSNPLPQPIQPPSQTNTAVNSQTSANLTSQNQGKNPQPTAQISTTVNSSNSQRSTKLTQPIRSKTNMTSVGYPKFSPDFDNSAVRTPVVLLLDTSGSMKGEPIQELNRGLEAFQQELLGDLQAKLSAEVTTITFGGVVKQIHDFVSADQFQPPQFEKPAGLTPMGKAIELALDTLENRKKFYKENAMDYYRPWIVLITDGAPSDEWQNAAERVQNAEKTKKAAFFAIAVQGANMEILKQIAPQERPPAILNQLKFIELFVWLANSVKSVSKSKKGDELDLQPIQSWGTITS